MDRKQGGGYAKEGAWGNSKRDQINGEEKTYIVNTMQYTDDVS